MKFAETSRVRRAAFFATAASALALTVGASPAFAQDANPAEEPADNAREDVIVVTGIRGAIDNAVAQKRENTSIVDVMLVQQQKQSFP